MALDKSTVKVRLETPAGDKLSLNNVSGVGDSRLSCVTSAKLKSLDTDGDGELSLQELIASLDVQLKQKHQLKFQRYIIIAGVALLLCSFGLSLGSSVVSFLLMSQMEVHNKALTDREGNVLGSQPRNPTVNNLTIKDSPANRRLEFTPSMSSSGEWQLPLDDVKKSMANYKSGAVEFIVPFGSKVYTAKIAEAEMDDEAGTASARGLLANGEKWTVLCEPGEASCTVEFPQLSLMSRAQPPTRRLDTYPGATFYPCGCLPGFEYCETAEQVVEESYFCGQRISFKIKCPDGKVCFDQHCFSDKDAVWQAQRDLAR